MPSKIKLVIATLAIGLLASYIVVNSEATPSKEVLIKFSPQVSQHQIDSLTTALGLTKVKSIQEVNVEVYQIDSEYSVAQVVQFANNSPYVVYAEPTAEMRALSTKSVPAVQAAVASSTAQARVPEYKEGEIIVKFKSDVPDVTINSVLATAGIRIRKTVGVLGVHACTIPSDKTVLQAVEECKAYGNIEYAEPNYIYRASVTPNDPQFSQLYGMTIIDAPQAWDQQKGSRDVIVGVIDTGCDYDHEDLQANIWHNPGETGNGKENNNVDDDGNGFVDDFRGWDFLNDENDPFDDNNHGTHVSGTVGAEGNNSRGVVGVNWAVSIMPLKFLGADGSGTTDDAVDAIIYGANNGAKVLSNSWGGGGFSRALEDAIKYANDRGVLFVAAAGNEGSDNDRFPTYPANYEVENVIAVAASTSGDNLASFSNRGKKTVHLAAPGNSILSTLPNDRYGSFSGTSMATPHVGGAAALVWAQFPSSTMSQVKTRILGSVERLAAFSDAVSTGGRLNVHRAFSTNPIIANTTRLDNTLDETGPYVVEADILDDSSIQSASLTYQVSGASAVTVAMSNTSGDHYRGEIPGQTLGSTIVYFVSATDNAGNETRDSNFSFSIAEPTDGGGGCCGKPAIDLAIPNPHVKTAANALVNISLFVLPLIALRINSIRKKRRSE